MSRDPDFSLSDFFPSGCERVWREYLICLASEAFDERWGRDEMVRRFRADWRNGPPLESLERLVDEALIAMNDEINGTGQMREAYAALQPGEWLTENRLARTGGGR